MNYLKLKQKIYEAIERNPLDRSAYEEMFAVCREYEKIDFQTAHAWNHELRNRISWQSRFRIQRNLLGFVESWRRTQRGRKSKICKTAGRSSR